MVRVVKFVTKADELQGPGCAYIYVSVTSR
jgi:hypothetical protein